MEFKFSRYRFWSRGVTWWKWSCVKVNVVMLSRLHWMESSQESGRSVRRAFWYSRQEEVRSWTQCVKDGKDVGKYEVRVDRTPGLIKGRGSGKRVLKRDLKVWIGFQEAGVWEPEMDRRRLLLREDNRSPRTMCGWTISLISPNKWHTTISFFSLSSTAYSAPQILPNF